MELHQKYYPITATPFKNNNTYREYVPCDALKPYVRCFWGYEKPIEKEYVHEIKTEIVTPDTCMDIMFTVNYTDNKIYSSFSGLYNQSFMVHSEEGSEKKSFCAAIRFYAWGASLFAEDSLKGTKNSFYDVEVLFSNVKKEIEAILYDISDMQQFITYAEDILIKNLNTKHKNDIVMQSVGNILEHKGNLTVHDMKNWIHISDRQLERLFNDYVGVSPKLLASMIRYQYVWKDIVFNKENTALDLVSKYGYVDQSHMLHEFKKYHGMSIRDACKHAYENVGNVQYIIL